MSAHNHWFLPQNPDVMGMLQRQSATTTEGLDALAAWARGDASAGPRLRELEHQADREKRELRESLTVAFSTPLEPEDIFELSRGLDEIINSAKNVVGEADAMGTPPDPPMAEMAAQLAAGTRQLGEGLARFAEGDRDGATALADRAVKDQRNLQHSYREAMSALVRTEDLREVTARRELYRRLARAGDDLVLVAERVWYSVLKES